VTKRDLSTRQKILKAIREYQHENGYSPTVRELQEISGLSTPSAVEYHLNILEANGEIQRDKNVARSIQLKQRKQTYTIPLIGRIFASQPIPVPGTDFSYTDYESTVDVALSNLPKRDIEKLFALEVKGDSMIDAMVNEGDIIILKPFTEIQSGKMYAVWLKDESTTTLKFIRRDGKAKSIWLHPANPTMKPIKIENPASLEIQGEAVTVIRKF
jgi:repressor LexA